MLSAICFNLDQSKILSSGNICMNIISRVGKGQRKLKLLSEEDGTIFVISLHIKKKYDSVLWYTGVRFVMNFANYMM